MTTYADVLIIGSGQAGLATGYYLNQSKNRVLILDSNSRVGDSWRNRYDSLVLFTPKGYSSLPGMPFPGDKNQLPDKNETADYLEAYANHFQIPIQLNTTVHEIGKRNERFEIKTDKGEYHARNVVIATGPFHKPWIPEFSRKLSSSVNQLHSSGYKNPKQLVKGDTLVVGAGNSGAQIAVEISDKGNVVLAAGHRPVSLPLSFLGKSVFYWFDKLGLLNASAHSFLGKKIKSRPDPIFGLEFKRRVESSAIALFPKAVDAHNETICFADGSKRRFANIVWCMGFRSDYGWLQIPHVLNEKGSIIHERGVTAERGLFVVGMPWQYRRTSALIGGVGEDAKFVAETIRRMN